MNYSDEEKIKRFLDAQEHPEHYTDEELQEIINEAQPIVQLKRALTEQRVAGFLPGPRSPTAFQG